ncbi:MAG: hypothetical protein A2896_01725 [Candidatus Nealsonbacteria bacterium RIFCSPLOWO2_01_FULL_43_32]|uniref:Integrase catalytic domain-containing protein n=1 Tax=Candidatus Nealsonbacteria bacterium RIFCSPLOWO2_01_FULL_43_32 TaxID=1801672 RepID=A0A1G2EEX9_9BACT|nr:MAG: hypothetical protein A2896_01725 [Candidatus Nealsonbacteria bacterium RIFCSPLOWO2_01_FULL_43_32]
MRRTARYVGVYPGTVSKWLDKDRWYGRIPLATLSSRPEHSPNALPDDIVGAIVRQRKKRNRCAEVIQQELLNQGLTVSLSSVKRTLERQGLIRKRSPWKRWHFTLPRPEIQKPGDLIQIDTVHLGPCNQNRLYVYALIDVFSRWAWALPSLRINTHISLRFVREALKTSGFPFSMLQSDHGSEFSKWFTKVIEDKGVLHRHSRVRKPTDNGHVERFIQTLQKDCLDRIPRTMKSWQKEIPEFIRYYNLERPHMGLDYKTPMQVVRSY